jgi:hypothetical protein
MAKITEIEVKSVGEIITYLSEHGNANDLTLYRGQKKDWSLEPKVSRIKLRGNEDIVESEKKMYYDFEFYSKPYFNKDGLFSLDILSVAQHHGMATRLLDWTRNPLAAIWFAVNEVPIQDNYGVVWKFETKKEDYVGLVSPYEIVDIKLYRPDLNSNRIINQNAVFSIHGYSKEISSFVKLDEHEEFQERLIKFIIPSKLFWSFRYDLDILGINRMSLFPDLDGVSKHIEWLNSNYEDEIGKNRYSI